MYGKDTKILRHIIIDMTLGFQSIFYFSRLFKSKTGSNPTALRKMGK